MSLINKLKRGIRFIIFGIPNVTYKASISYSTPSNTLKNKKIIITGGGRGLGRSMAEKFIKEGAKVLISGRNEKVLKATASELGCEYLCFDVSDANMAESFIISSINLLGGIDCLVNNAGISLHEGRIENVSIEQFDKQISTNLRGAYFVSQAFIKHYKPNRDNWGAILFVSSERGQYVDDLPYGITKAAINSLTQGLCYRLIDKCIRVNAVAPGVTTSEMTGFTEDNLHCGFYKTHRVYLPGEVAEVAAFLLSDNANCLSGQIIVCNNGQSTNSYLR